MRIVITVLLLLIPVSGICQDYIVNTTIGVDEWSVTYRWIADTDQVIKTVRINNRVLTVKEDDANQASFVIEDKWRIRITDENCIKRHEGGDYN